MPKQQNEPQFTNLTLISVDNNYWINTIKVVREVAKLGLKESHDLVNEVRSGQEHTLLRNVNITEVRAAKRQFAKVGAKVRMGKFDSAEVSNA